jgi:hypothetical protein
MEPCKLSQLDESEANLLVVESHFDFYDGPIKGVLSCRCCGNRYFFHLTDMSPPFARRAFALFSRLGRAAAKDDSLEADWVEANEQKPAFFIKTDAYLETVFSAEVVAPSDQREFAYWSTIADESEE